jgi:hypothetical protein
MIRDQRPGALLAIVVAYALALQALMASVGLGMSAAAASGNDGFALCVHAADSRTTVPGDGRLPNPAPQCPFCFVAAQSSCDVAAGGGAPQLPAYTGLSIAGRLAGGGGNTFVPQFRRTVGDPRGPPAVSI